jgi:hypothetical protein
MTIRFFIHTHTHTHTQGVPGEKVNIVGGQYQPFLIRKVCMYKCPTLNSFRDRAISLYSSKIVGKKEIQVLHTFSSTGICSNDKIGTVYLV